MATTDNELKLPAAVLEKWDAWYARTIGSAPTDAEELARIREYRARAEEGFTLTEEGEEARVGRQRWPAAEPQAGAQPAAPVVEARRKRLILAGMAGATLLMCVLVIAILSPLLKSSGRAQAAAGSTPGVIPTTAPVLVDVGGNERFALDTPRSLEIRGSAFQVVAGEVTQAGALKYPQLRDGLVVWFPSPANWLIGADGRVVAALSTGDMLIARTATGRVLHFVVDQVDDVEPQAVEALAQGRAGLVLFPLHSEGESVRLVSARYDPSGEQPDTTAQSDAMLGQPLHLSAGSVLTVTGAEVQRQRDGLNMVTVYYTATGSLPPLLLDLQGQLYPPVHPRNSTGAGGLAVHPAQAQFYVSSLGTAEIVVAEKRVDLGVLAPPALLAQIKDVQITDTALVVTCVISSTSGSASLAPGDITLLAGNGGPGGEIAPQQWTPADALIAPGAPVQVVVQFALPQGAAFVRVRLFDVLWEISGLTP